MSNKPTSISAVVVTYRRTKNIEMILGAWLHETKDVWLCDCTEGGFQTKLPVNIIRATPDPGNRIRHAVALLTKGDLVIKADDDIVPLPGLAADFIRNYEQFGEAIYGIHGRTFKGERYYLDTRLCGGKNVGQTDAGKIDSAPAPASTEENSGGTGLDRFRHLIEDACAKHGLDPSLVAAVIMQESSGNPQAVLP